MQISISPQNLLKEGSPPCLDSLGASFMFLGIMREKCYGECFVAVKTLLECGGVLDADIYLTPKPVKGRFSPMP